MTTLPPSALLRPQKNPPGEGAGGPCHSSSKPIKRQKKVISMEIMVLTSFAIAVVLAAVSVVLGMIE